jgi:hypothetical protein
MLYGVHANDPVTIVVVAILLALVICPSSRHCATVESTTWPKDRLQKMWMGHAHKDLTDQYAKQLREDVKSCRKWCEKIGLGFVLRTNVSQLSQPKPAARGGRKAA